MTQLHPYLPEAYPGPDASSQNREYIEGFVDSVRNEPREYSRAAMALGTHVASKTYHQGLKLPIPESRMRDTPEAYRHLHGLFLGEHDRHMTYDTQTKTAINSDVKMLARQLFELQDPSLVPKPEANSTMLAVASTEYGGPKNEMLRVTEVSIFIRRTLRHLLSSRHDTF
ncbi:MAG: hypothetical protein QG629_169 [Patescibacteria group bacterium]|nr:hypothetical protein [Candidatus Saccharibacteria bacterium]MDQ5963087.1 hypothetical protein [Patescibacteria group bacterium]